MAVTTTKILRLTFETAGGKTFSITIPDPKVNLQQADAETVMDMIIEKNVYITTSGELTRKRDIKVINTSTEDLYDPPQV
ncbi:DUF2922 domain-containing protein [Desulfosporosinus lacus]|uniref:DUF2922 domain-containing protein n=1 Tax=Desulfosporosinus lacus DSM 15449 TaxID=1121420 RepID=A0A1M5ZRZ6_9FIRM|nr:DUF2922 domain-containing protein [Desulfosporosinus lacus]SHI26938.1 Protein of unknown function [Desulfosporosinus lacus DSM 15449]